jgi:hypothetical protein
MAAHPARPSSVPAATVLACLLSACGGSQNTPAAGAQPAADAGVADMPPSLKDSGGGPDPAQAQERLLANANMVTPDAVRIVSYSETGVRYEGPPEMQSSIVSYEAELEFTTDTYFHADHKAGDHARVYGEIEYLNEGGQWRIIAMGIYPR